MIYRELRAKISIPPTAQSKYLEMYKDATLDWKEIYMLPFRVALDTKTREFHSKILNRYLVTNVLLSKIGIKSSSACTLCESLEHIFTSCTNVLSSGQML